MKKKSDIYDAFWGDAEIWQRLKRGDKNALELIFHRYHADLYRYAVKLVGDTTLAQDHIQDLFLRIWNRRENLGDVTGVKTYLWTALRRTLLDERRKKSVYEKRTEEKAEPFKSLQFSAEELMIHQEQHIQRRQALRQALDQLSVKQREVLYLKYFDGMSYGEIEQIMSINYQTARNYVYEGLKTLKVILKAHTGDIVLPGCGLILVAWLLLHFLSVFC